MCDVPKQTAIPEKPIDTDDGGHHKSNGSAKKGDDEEKANGKKSKKTEKVDTVVTAK